MAGKHLGYRASWPLFALTHHLVVWWSAEQVYPGKRFDRYALLGDDIVISKKLVANVYLEVLKYLQVKTSTGKTLVSHTGCAEFAKQFLIRNVSVDLSSVTLKALLGVHIPICKLGIAHRYTVKRYSTFRRLGGAGYKSASRPPNSGQSDIEKIDWCLWVQLNFPTLEWFFGEGRPLKPTQFWWVYRRILCAYSPQDCKCPPDDLFVSEEKRTFLEYTGLRCQVSQWLDYYKWWLKYYKVAYGYLDYSRLLDYLELDQVSLDEVFDAPFVNGAWGLSNLDHVRVRYTFLHRIKAELYSSLEIGLLPVQFCSRDGIPKQPSTITLKELDFVNNIEEE